jgi:hypothetical protein
MFELSSKIFCITNSRKEVLLNKDLIRMSFSYVEHSNPMTLFNSWKLFINMLSNLLSNWDTHIWTLEKSLVLVSKSQIFFQDLKEIHIGTIVSIFPTHELINMLPCHICASRKNSELVIFHLKTCIVFSHGGVQVLEVACGDRIWHVKQCLPSLHIHCFTLQKTTKKTTNHG